VMIDLTTIDWVNVGTALLVALVGYFISRRISRVAERALAKKMPEGSAKNLSRIIYYVFIFVMILFVLTLLGLKVDSLLVAGGVIGMAIGFASQKTVSNFISGIFLYIDRPMNIGDSVNIGGSSGVVLDITPFSTRLRSWDGPVVRIPNSKVFDSEITNYKQTVARRVEYSLRISYDSSTDKAIQLIKEELAREPFVLTSPGPDVHVSKLGDSAVEITVKFWTPAPKMYAVKTRMLQRIYQTLKKAGVSIPYPRMDIRLSNKVKGR